MALGSWKVNEKGCHEVLQQPGVAAKVREVSQAGVEFAQSFAPVRTGRYLESLFVVEPRLDETGSWVGGFGTNVPYWHFVEFGSPHNLPRRVLSNAAIAVSNGKWVPQ